MSRQPLRALSRSTSRRESDTGRAKGAHSTLITALRNWSDYIGKANVVKGCNRAYCIEDRVHVANASKAKLVREKQMASLTGRRTIASVCLAHAYGLRREGAIKIWPQWADMGDKLRLKDSCEAISALAPAHHGAARCPD
jgi:hypothetical protein